MTDNQIKDIVIVGGGTAGWMAAAALGRQLGSSLFNIRLIESEEIGTVGVGEATIPHITYFNKMLGIDEPSFLKKTNATFKLGIEFVNWDKLGESYVHPFGPYGVDMQGVHFHHSWMRQYLNGSAKPIDDFCLPSKAAKAGKFQHGDPKLRNSPLNSMSYAYQFDAALYAKFMREFAHNLGVKRTEGKIVNVRQNLKTEFIEALELENGEVISGDLFIDCSGFRGLLTEQTLKTGYDDWSHYLPCDRAVARLSERLEILPPYTRATAKEAGWQWRIPLQTRTGNGYVYSSQYISDDEAMASLNKDLDTAPIADARLLKFKTGIRKKPWNKNVVAIGLAAGFLEPLESTSIHLIQTGVARLLTNFPDKNFNQPDIDFYNEATHLEYEQVRDFLILHYHVTQRDDTPFWNYCRTMDIPESLSKRLAIYKENGRLYRNGNELFNHVSWFAVMHGQGILPKRYHPLANALESDRLDNRLSELHRVTQRCVEVMPTHEDYLKQMCDMAKA